MQSDIQDTLFNTPKPTGVNWGCGVILHSPVSNKILIGKRTDNSLMCTPGGKIENGESVINAVMRETQEECGLVLEKLYFLGMKEHKAPTGAKWLSFIFYSNRYSGKLVPQLSEVESWTWASVATTATMELFEPTRDSLTLAVACGYFSSILPTGMIDDEKKRSKDGTSGTAHLNVSDGSTEILTSVPVFDKPDLPTGYMGMYNTWECNSYTCVGIAGDDYVYYD